MEDRQTKHSPVNSKQASPRPPSLVPMFISSKLFVSSSELVCCELDSNDGSSGSRQKPLGYFVNFVSLFLPPKPVVFFPLLFLLLCGSLGNGLKSNSWLLLRKRSCHTRADSMINIRFSSFGSINRKENNWIVLVFERIIYSHDA